MLLNISTVHSPFLGMSLPSSSSSTASEGSVSNSKDTAPFSNLNLFDRELLVPQAKLYQKRTRKLKVLEIGV